MATREDMVETYHTAFFDAVAVQIRRNPGDHYRVLGVPPGSDLARLKVHHRHLARYFHPDRWPEGVPAKYVGVMEAVNIAFDVLTDTAARRSYDTVAHVAKLVCPRCKGTGGVSRSKGFKQKVEVGCDACDSSGWYDPVSRNPQGVKLQ